MKNRNILVVESKPGSTGNLEKTLRGLSYGVRVINFRHDDMAKAVEDFMPDILIVDMSVNADKNIIAKATLVQSDYSVPVIYFTEAINSRTLYQTMKTIHYGYIYTPYDESSLETTIELALRKHKDDMSVRESELKYKELFNNMSSGVAIFNLADFGTRYVFSDLNTAACVLLKRHREEIVGRSVTDIYFNAEKFGFLAAIKRVAETGEPLKMDAMYYEDTAIRGWYNSYVYKLPDGSLVHIFHDITEQVEVEKKLIDKQKELELMNMELAKAVVEETDKRKKNEQIIFEQSRFLAMGQMISAIAHQWRQPLSALGINIEDLEDAYNAGELDEQYIKELTADSMSLIKTISKTMDDLSNFFKSGHDEERFVITDVMGEVYSLQQARMSKYGVKFRIKFNINGQTLYAEGADIYDLLPKVHPVYLTGVPAEFKQVIINIINNSVDAIIDANGGSESAVTGGEITVSVDASGGVANIAVADNGCGIRTDLVNKIFEPYFTTKETGSGIGLYMSKVIIEEHMNGRLTAASLPKGAVMTINLPYNQIV